MVEMEIEILEAESKRRVKSCYYCNLDRQERVGRTFYEDMANRFYIVAGKCTGYPMLVWRNHEGPDGYFDVRDGLMALKDVCLKVIGAYYILKMRKLKGHFIVTSVPLKICIVRQKDIFKRISNCGQNISSDKEMSMR